MLLVAGGGYFQFIDGAIETTCRTGYNVVRMHCVLNRWHTFVRTLASIVSAFAKQGPIEQC